MENKILHLMCDFSLSWMGSADAELALEAEHVRNVKIIFGEIRNLLVAKVRVYTL